MFGEIGQNGQIVPRHVEEGSKIEHEQKQAAELVALEIPWKPSNVTRTLVIGKKGHLVSLSRSQKHS